MTLLYYPVGACIHTCWIDTPVIDNYHYIFTGSIGQLSESFSCRTYYSRIAAEGEKILTGRPRDWRHEAVLTITLNYISDVALTQTIYCLNTFVCRWFPPKKLNSNLNPILQRPVYRGEATIYTYVGCMRLLEIHFDLRIASEYYTF